MKRISFKKYIVPFLMFVLAVMALFGAKHATAAVKRLEKLQAYYTGGAVAVGEKINTKDFYLMAEYYIHDGYMEYTEYEDVKRGFTISPEVINAPGDNQIVVSYRGKSTVVTVQGKAVDRISAEYIGEELYTGAPIPKAKVEVYAYYDDGSCEKVKDFTLSITTVSKVGLNTIPVVYNGKTEYIYIYGKAPLAVEELVAYYVGEPIIEGNSINKSDIEVTALYNDGTMKEIKNFNISPSVVKEEGENEIIVSYGDISTVIEIYGMERVAEEMSAKYTGPGVIVGKLVDKNDIEVTLTFNDGSKEDTEDFEIYGEEIFYEGENIVLVYCDAFMADVTVMGVKGFAANYDNCLTNVMISNDFSSYSEVTLGMNMGLEKDKFAFRTIDAKMADRIVRRVMPTKEFIAFELFYEDDEMVLEFPMAMKVTVPEEYDPEKFGIYYTKKNSTVVAKLDGEFLDEERTEFEFVVQEPGYYILMHEVTEQLVTDIVVEEEITLKENRNYSLNPVVFPLNAENKELMFSSTDEDVATVSGNGKIRTHSAGTCEIWVEAMDESGVYVVVYLEVIER